MVIIRGTELRERRLALGMTQEALAQAAGLYSGTISDMENNKNSRAATLRKVAKTVRKLEEQKGIRNKTAPKREPDALVEAVKEHMETLSISQNQFAKECGLSGCSISRIINGQSSLTPRARVKIETALSKLDSANDKPEEADQLVISENEEEPFEKADDTAWVYLVDEAWKKDFITMLVSIKIRKLGITRHEYYRRLVIEDLRDALKAIGIVE